MTWDVLILGGSFSGASLGILLRRELPGLKVLIVERSEQFDRKVGEATTEISGEFLHKRLALTSYLANHHISKQGLRMWFTENADTPFDECAEIGANYQVRLPAFQLDREKLDTHLLETAEAEGCELWRPARVKSVEGTRAIIEKNGKTISVDARWVIDASGRAAVLSRTKGLLRPLNEHPTNALWARFRGAGDLDGHTLRSANAMFGRTSHASRSAATNHLTGYGWWCWIIPLKGGDFSAGLVYDSRLYAPPSGARIADRLKAHLMTHPVGRVLFENAEPQENDARAYSHLPYFSTEIAGPGWQLVGDAAGFLDPLYSPGLDYASWTIRLALARIKDELETGSSDLAEINRRFRESYDSWFRALYKDKYYYLGDAELMSAAYWMDISLFYLGPVREITVAREHDRDCLPFNGPADTIAGKFMRFYNQRLSAIARKRRLAGCYGHNNTGWRELGDGFVPDPRVLVSFFRGFRRWMAAELHALTLRPQPVPVEEPMNPATVS